MQRSRNDSTRPRSVVLVIGDEEHEITARYRGAPSWGWLPETGGLDPAGAAGASDGTEDEGKTAYHSPDWCIADAARALLELSAGKGPGDATDPGRSRVVEARAGGYPAIVVANYGDEDWGWSATVRFVGGGPGNPFSGWGDDIEATRVFRTPYQAIGNAVAWLCAAVEKREYLGADDSTWAANAM